MTLKIYIGTADEITARLAGIPNSTTTTVASGSSSTSLYLASLTSFAAGNSIVVGKHKTSITEITTPGEVLIDPELPSDPEVGDTVRHYNADYTKYRDQSQPFSLIDDRKTGGNTGSNFGQDLTFFDSDGLMPNIIEQNLITIFDSVDEDNPLFAGVIVSSERIMKTKDREETPIYQWQIEAWGYQWEADSVGVDEQPFTNVNAGEFLEYIAGKWTNLNIGEVDTTDSPNLDFVRLSPFRRFSDIGTDVANLWPGAEFFIQNRHTYGALYFRQEVQEAAPITLNQEYLDKIGSRRDQYVRIRKDYEKVFNIVLLPYYKEQIREPDFHVQSTVTDNAFLKTSVTLAGQPSLVEESQLLFDDFADGELSTDFTEDDIDNPDPPEGFNQADGFLVEGEVNQVAGLHLLDTTDVSATVKLGDIGRVTDPAEVEPFTGEERQMISVQELVVNTLGEGVVLGIVDLTTVQTTILSGSTTSRIYVPSTAGFSVNDRITIGEGDDAQKGYISVIGAGYFDLIDTLDSAPTTGQVVSLHRLAKSRIKFGVYFKANGDLKYIKDGVETAFDTPRTYSAVQTYSLRLFMQSFETTIAGGISSTGCTLDSITNFADGDVVDIFTTGSRLPAERRIIQVGSGAEITYTATSQNPEIGYRVRTHPKMVLQIKGGTEYGSITGREWTTIYTAQNTWQNSETVDKDEHAVLLCSNKSLVATFSLFQMKNPIPVTAQVGSRYLHIGTQEIDSTEPDIDCILRKVGSHFQLDFFPDTKTLWSSGSALELRYKERWRVHLQTSDIASIHDLAAQRGHAIPDGATEQTMVRLGGRALDTLEIQPFPLTDEDALLQSQAILEAVSTPAYSVEIMTNTYLDLLCKAGQWIRSELEGVPDMQIQRVEIREFPGAQGDDGQSLYRQRIVAGTVDRLSEILRKRTLAKATRLVIDDGRDDDTFSKLLNAAFKETATVTDKFVVTSFDIPDGGGEEEEPTAEDILAMSPVVWLDSYDSNSIIETSGINTQIAKWFDISGNDNDAGLPGYDPTFSTERPLGSVPWISSDNGTDRRAPWLAFDDLALTKKVVEFAHIAHCSDFLGEFIDIINEPITGANFTMFFVVKNIQTKAFQGGSLYQDYQQIVSINSAYYGNRYMELWLDGLYASGTPDTLNFQISNNIADITLTRSVDWDISSKYLVAIRYTQTADVLNNATLELWINGQAVPNSQVGSMNIANWLYRNPAAENTNNVFELFALFGGNAYSTMMFNEAITDEKLETIRTYLNNRFTIY
jgi:hypothetical protein